MIGKTEKTYLELMKYCMLIMEGNECGMWTIIIKNNKDNFLITDTWTEISYPVDQWAPPTISTSFTKHCQGINGGDRFKVKGNRGSI